ncbi:MAG: hypothetical protein JWP57_4414 [Spirosoma sp.]|nr:hypothetical protein [Spirosoma sp.]
MNRAKIDDIIREIGTLSPEEQAAADEMASGPNRVRRANIAMELAEQIVKRCPHHVDAIMVLSVTLGLILEATEGGTQDMTVLMPAIQAQAETTYETMRHLRTAMREGRMPGGVGHA